MPNVITFNGTTYNSVDDMPPDVRQMYQQMMGGFGDDNQNGIPDMVEGLIPPEVVQKLSAHLSSIMFNGQAYPNLDQMPPEARAKYEEYQARFDANRNGVPDAVEGLLAQMGGAAPPSSPTGWSSGMPVNSVADAAVGPAFTLCPHCAQRVA